MTSTEGPIGSHLFGELVTNLIDLTDEGKVEWREPQIDNTNFEYEVDIGDYNIDIRSSDKDGQLPYVLRVFQDSELVVKLDSREDREWNASLTDLYQAVVRQITRVDLKLEPLINQLRSLKDLI